MKMLLSMLFCSLMAFETALASTLVTKGPDGTYKPGVAKSWKSEGSTTTFSFADETRATEVGKILSERLANAKITVSNTDVRIVGIPSTALLEQHLPTLRRYLCSSKRKRTDQAACARRLVASLLSSC